jgi:hypothetical protein
MLPVKVYELLVSLRERTESRECHWDYDDEASEVSLDQKRYHITIRYTFNTVEEVGQFTITYFDKETKKQHYFSTSQEYADYEIVRRLFDSAQASGLNFDL